MSRLLRSFVSVLLMVAIVSIGVFTASAQNADLTPEQEAALRAELSSIEAQIAEQQQILKSKQNQERTLKGDIDILNAQIKEAQLKIQAHELAINKLGKDITVKVNTIKTLTEKIQISQKAIADILQKSRELDDYSLVEALLVNKDVSEFFVDIDAYSSLKRSLKEQLDSIREAKTQNEVAKKDLNQKRDQEIDLKVNVQAEQTKIKNAEAEKKKLLALNKNEQLNYQTVIQNKQKRAQEIKNALFKLRDAASIKFGDAVVLAKRASQKTGVRAAYILAIIQQESNLGANVGQCYLTDTVTGAGKKKSSGAAVQNVMKPSRDVQPFLEIIGALGRTQENTVVSCPLSVGYGGAMGPAQFIPSTWKLFQSRIATNVGRQYSDPWNPEDAFMASALYLADLGAANQSYTSERNAACRYYSGRSCSGSNTFYGDQVMGRVNSIDANIKILDNSGQ